ncbi:c-di-GMP-binding flagellar brake protein YcgR, contains PilZNR and PilZ domains [Selenomonas ruminantium]|uniref:C-di-GMP-binding flagellar brake protein YcgR, contains PilZNR and PilZ domains n=1 Tax=Selenomonas ruminantium TaxID=971 RepID=A0A1M6RN45_SELRU|nr:flagellar brake domain-containing protein [Selenomonas ruminantium]SHK33941.1 c-di-GMP-binding flagellar brake protein YcgR, contains PilZNR and PilZ domains [Selenomonas ruminantium]
MAGELLKAKDILKIGQRVEFYVENDEKRYASRIEDIADETLEVAMPMTRQGVPVIPRDGEKVYGVAVGHQCRYRFFTVFKGISHKDERIPVWYITMPDKVERFQNREFVRVKVNMTAKIRIVDEDGTIHDAETVPVVDLSGSGICLALSHTIPVDIHASLELTGIPGAGNIDIMCRVVRCEPVERGDGTVIYHAGAAFQHLSRSLINQIVRYLFAVQRANIAKGLKE